MRLVGLATVFPRIVLATHPAENRGEYHSLTRTHLQQITRRRVRYKSVPQMTQFGFSAPLLTASTARRRKHQTGRTMFGIVDVCHYGLPTLTRHAAARAAAHAALRVPPSHCRATARAPCAHPTLSSRRRKGAAQKKRRRSGGPSTHLRSHEHSPSPSAPRLRNQHRRRC